MQSSSSPAGGASTSFVEWNTRPVERKTLRLNPHVSPHAANSRAIVEDGLVQWMGQLADFGCALERYNAERAYLQGLHRGHLPLTRCPPFPKYSQPATTHIT